MRLIMVGDVHGCLEELEELIAAVAPQKEDHWIFLGDLVHKGPHSRGVVQRVRYLEDEVRRVTTLRGNHEEKAIRAHRRGDSELSLSEEDWGLIHATQYYWSGPVGPTQVLAVHAGVPNDIPGPLLPHHDTIIGLSNSKRKPYDRMLHLRRIDKETGKFLPLEKSTPEHPFWADLYDGRLGFVVFGHEAFVDAPKPVRFPSALGIDLGCVYGGRLCAAVWPSDELFDIYSVRTVKARQAYADRLDIE